jgi:cytochrome c-type biogenesis protein CcmF
VVARKLWVVLAVAACWAWSPSAWCSRASALASAGLVVGFWLIGGALLELAERLKLFRVPAPRAPPRHGSAARRLGHDPGPCGPRHLRAGGVVRDRLAGRGGPGLSLNGSQPLGAYTLTLTDVGTVEGPNYLAERGS